VIGAYNRNPANGFNGGVHVVKPAKEAREVASKMLGQTLVTHRASAAPLIVASTEGGVEIETVAAALAQRKLFANQSALSRPPSCSQALLYLLLPNPDRDV
jgi:succinyl-CoA synthetase beta subunit